MIFNVTPSTNGTFTSPTVLFRLLDPRTLGIVSRKVTCNKTTFPGLETWGLFLDPSQAANDIGAKALQGLTDGSNGNAQQVYPDISIK